MALSVRLVALALGAAALAACGLLAAPGDYTSAEDGAEAGAADGPSAPTDGPAKEDAVVVLPDGNVAQSKGTLVVIAGEREPTSQEDDPAYAGDVMSGVLDANGIVALWRYERPAPIIGSFDSLVVADGRLFTLSFGYGIFQGRNNALQSVAWGPGPTGEWKAGRAQLPGGLDEATRTFAGSHVVTIGGTRTVAVDGGSNTFFVKEVHGATLDTAKSELGAFTDAPNLVNARSRPGALLVDDRLYVAGGRAPVSGGMTASVEAAKVDVAAGTMDAFAEGPALMTGGGEYKVVQPQLVSANGYVYLAGGRVANNAPTDVVLVSKIDAGTGALGAWQDVTKLPKPVRDFAFVAHEGMLYVMGGQTADGRSDEVYSAPINGDGTLGAWDTTSNAKLPGKRSDFVAVAYE